MKRKNESRYLAYMLRLWRVGDAGQPIWRASLESPHTGERHSFADLETLLRFLQERTVRAPETDGAGGENI